MTHRLFLLKTPTTGIQSVTTCPHILKDELISNPDLGVETIQIDQWCDGVEAIGDIDIVYMAEYYHPMSRHYEQAFFSTTKELFLFVETIKKHINNNKVSISSYHPL